MSKRRASPFDMIVIEEPTVDPTIEMTKMAREIRREHWRNEYDMGFHEARPALSRKDWVDNKLREEGLL